MTSYSNKVAQIKTFNKLKLTNGNRKRRAADKRISTRLQRAADCLIGVDPIDQARVLESTAYGLGGDKRIPRDEAFAVLKRAAVNAGMRPWEAAEIIDLHLNRGTQAAYDPTDFKNLTDAEMQPYFDIANDMPAWAEALKQLDRKRMDPAILAESYMAALHFAQKYGEHNELGLITFRLSYRQWIEWGSVTSITLQRHTKILENLGLLQKIAAPDQGAVTTWVLRPVQASKVRHSAAHSLLAASEASHEPDKKGGLGVAHRSSPYGGCTTSVTLPKMQNFVAKTKLRRSGKYVENGVGAKGRYILALLSENMELSVRDMVNATGFSVASVRRVVNRLLQRLPESITVSLDGNVRRYTLNTGFSQAVEVVSERDGSWIPGVIAEDFHYRARMGWKTPWFGRVSA